MSDARLSDEALNGHIDVVEQCSDWISHRAMDDGDPSGRLADFVESIDVVLGIATHHRSRQLSAEDREALALIRRRFVGKTVGTWDWTDHRAIALLDRLAGEK